MEIFEMKKVTLFLFLLLLIGSSSVSAQKVESLDEAKTLAAASGKSILLEFVRQD